MVLTYLFPGTTLTARRNGVVTHNATPFNVGSLTLDKFSLLALSAGNGPTGQTHFSTAHIRGLLFGLGIFTPNSYRPVEIWGGRDGGF